MVSITWSVSFPLLYTVVRRESPRHHARDFVFSLPASFRRGCRVRKRWRICWMFLACDVKDGGKRSGA